MYPNCLISFHQQNKGPEVYPIKSLPDLLKVFPEGLFRSPFFFQTDKATQAISDWEQGTLPLSGPFLITHAIRRASDILLEEVGYEGISIQLEVDGKKLPELPSKQELELILKNEKTLVIIDGRSYRPSAEVFGFQNVYDDTDKTISTLKNWGIPQEIMNFLATPDEFSIEIHPGVFGLPEDPLLSRVYTALLYKIAGIKRGEKRFMKTADRTVITNTFNFKTPILLPGSSHPMLHRAKVEVGQTHFAYGIAAFSEHCAKKRSLDECLKEIRSWLKFLEKGQQLQEKVKDIVSKLSVPETKPSAIIKPGAKPTGPTGGFRPLKQEIPEAVNFFFQSLPMLPSPWPELNRALGGGWFPKGVHLIASPREEGKASWLLSQALHFAPQNRVLYLSREHSFLEFSTRIATWASKSPATISMQKSGPDSETVFLQFKKALDAISTKLSDTFFFRGVDSSVNSLNVDEITELLKMVPGSNEGSILILESLEFSELAANKDFLRKLKNQARNQGFTAFVSVHLKPGKLASPHFIEGTDLECLENWQTVTDTILSLSSEKANLKKFLAITQGKVEPAVAEKLEQNLYQAAGNARLPQDTFSFLRLIHNRLAGNRQAILNLFQRRILRFWEGFSFLLQRP